MRTRNADKPKPSPAVKPTRAAKKSADKTPQKPTELSPESSETPKSSGTKRTRAIHAKSKETQDIPTPEPAVEEAKTSAIYVTPEKTPDSVKKVTRVVKRKVVRKKTPASAKSSSVETSKHVEDDKEGSSKEEGKEVEDTIEGEPAENKEAIPWNVEEPGKKEDPVELVQQLSRKEEIEDMTTEGSEENKEAIVVNAGEYKLTELLVEHVEESAKKDDKVPDNQEIANIEKVDGEPKPSAEDVGITRIQTDATNAAVSSHQENFTVMQDVNTSKSQEPIIGKEDEEAIKVIEKIEVEDRTDNAIETVSLEEITTEELKEDEPSEQADMEHGDGKMEAKEHIEKIEVVQDGMVTTTETVNLEEITTEELKEDKPSEQADMEHGDENMEAKEVIEKTKLVQDGMDATIEPVNMEKITTEESEQVDMEHGDEDIEAKEVIEKTEVVQDGMNTTTEPVNMEKITSELREDEPSEQADMEHEDENMETKVIEETEVVRDGMDTTTEPVNMEKISTEESKEGEPSEQADIKHRDENMEEQGGTEILEEFNEGVLAQDNVTERGEKSQRSEDEQVELTAVAEDRRKKKELEIFVGGLDRDAVDEDVRKVFQHIGGVVEVRVHKDPSNNKNKGYAFVRFATKEQATQALADIKHPVINGKRCGTAPCEDNDTLFLGNICNTWTKETIRQKLNDYGIDGVENITPVSDPKHDGLSRGFAFIEFSCHGDAMLAYKRLQKPDVIFGHLERTAKVAFAEPLREPDPEVMSQVKSVFVDGLPPHWDEDHVRKVFNGYGHIEQITLARNMSSSKRKDFGFVDFSTHEAAIACIDGINSKELGDGNSKAKVKARLSNPLAKTQAVKGEMCGGFRIGHVSSGTLAHSARGFGQGAHSFNRTKGQRGRDFYHHGRGQTSRTGFAHNHDLDEPFRGRQNFVQGGRWGSSRGAHVAHGEGIPARFSLDRPRYDAINRVHERHMHFRGQPFPPEEFNRPFLETHSDDPYLYSDRAHGIKRPNFTDQDPRYMEPSRVRPRLDYPDPAVAFHGTHHRDNFGPGSSPYPHDYYAPNYSGRGGIRPSFYGGARPHRGGYHY